MIDMMAAMWSGAARVAARGRSLGLAVVAMGLVSGSPAIEAAHADPAPTLLWQRYPGTVELDSGQAVAIDSVGDIVIGGFTFGSIGRRNQGLSDGFVVKYSPDGTVKWRRQPAAGRYDEVTGLATDFAGNVIAVGDTGGPLAGPKLGGRDGFVVKYAASGMMQWRHQIGTTGDDYVRSVATDGAGNVIVAGWSVVDWDGFVIKYSAAGIEKWRRQLHTTGYDTAEGVATDAAGNIIVVGQTSGSLSGANRGGYDTFIAFYSADGTLKWIVQPGTTNGDIPFKVAIDATGKIFVTGQENVSADIVRGFLAAFSDDGTELWRHRLEQTYSWNNPNWTAVAIDSAGNAVITGTNFNQAYAASFTPGGVLQWTQQLPIEAGYKADPAIDAAGHLVIGGTIHRGVDRGYTDGYLAQGNRI